MGREEGEGSVGKGGRPQPPAAAQHAQPERPSGWRGMEEGDGGGGEPLWAGMIRLRAAGSPPPSALPLLGDWLGFAAVPDQGKQRAGRKERMLGFHGNREGRALFSNVSATSGEKKRLPRRAPGRKATSPCARWGGSGPGWGPGLGGGEDSGTPRGRAAEQGGPGHTRNAAARARMRPVDLSLNPHTQGGENRPELSASHTHTWPPLSSTSVRGQVGPGAATGWIPGHRAKDRFCLKPEKPTGLQLWDTELGTLLPPLCSLLRPLGLSLSLL